MPEKTCGDCKHFYPHPKDARTPIGTPVGGECRVEPPKLVQPIIQKTDQGPQLVGMLVSYLLLMETFPSCAKFEQSEERKDSFQIELVRK